MENKYCKRCDKTKPVEDFGRNKSKADGLQVSCKACVKQINRDYYTKTPEKNDARRAGKAAAIKAAQEFVQGILRQSECVDCGESDFRVLEFDHVRGVKSGNVSRMVLNGLSVATIKAEIEKCEVRCANDHRRVTYERMDSWRNAVR